MNNEQQELLDEAYENYCMSYKDGHEFYEDETVKRSYTKEEFINKCKTDPEFSEKWGLKIEERELSEGERGLLLQPLGLDPLTKEGRDRLWKENNLPTRLITITRELSYNERFKIAYKNLELRKKLEAESAMLNYPSGHIKVMDDNNIPTNKTIESYD